MIHVTSFNDEIVDFISHSDGAVIEAEHTLNVADKMETFDFTILTSRTEHMQTRNRIIIEDKDGQYREFVIYNISSDLNGYTRIQTNASALEDIKTAKPVAPHKLDKYTVKQALDYALADTGWEVADDAEWGGTRTTSWTGWHDRISILKQLETTYDMRLSFRVEVGSNKVTKRLVSLKKVEPMFNGEEIVYGDNMLELKRTVDFSDIATALICLGPEDSETGKREIVEIKDDDAQAQFGLPYRYIWDIYEPESSDESMTVERLTTLGRTALNKRKESTVSYDIKGVGLSASAGDMIRVKNEDFTPELYVDAEVVEVTTDLLSGETDYKFGVIKEYTRADVYARFYAMLDTLRERLNNVVSNTDSIISERLEKELASFERYIHKSDMPPLEPKEGDLWLDTSHDGVAVLYRFENGEWVKSSVDDVRDIGGMTREETMYETLKERKSRIEVDYSDVFNQYDTLIKDRYYHYVENDYRLDLENKFGVMKSAYDVFIGAFNNINSEQPTIGLLTTAISRAIDFEIALKNFRISYNVARKDFDAYMRILQSQYTEAKFNEAMEKVADSIGGTYDGTNIIADIPNQEDLNQLNKDIKDYLTGQIDTLDDKLGKKVASDIKTARDELSASIGSVEKKVEGLESANKEITQTVTEHDISIGLLENEISLKANSSDVTQQLDNALKPIQSSVQTNEAELQVQKNLINQKVNSTQYTADMNNVTRDLQTATTERKQLAESISQTVSIDEYKKGTENLVKDSDKKYNTPNYLIAEYTLSEPIELNETYTITVKGNVQNTNGGLAILIDKGRYFISRNTPKVDDDIYQITFTANDNTWITDNVRLYNYPSANRINAEIEWIKVERGSIATPHSKSPQDTEEVLTQYNTEINQAKDSINKRVSYEQFNKSNKTLERLITSLNQTSTGLDFTIDTNGVIQGFNLNKDKFRFDSKMIEFNDGDVVIKDGKTSITQAFIDSLFANSAFISNLKAIDIDFNRASARGQNGTDYIEILSSKLELGGQYTWNWTGSSKTYNSATVFQSGYMRMTDVDINQHLFYTQKGISTFNDGNQNLSSGTLEFFSYEYDPIRKGVTLSSVGGVVALRSSLDKIILDALDNVYLMSTKQRVKVQPRKELSGNNTFEFHVVDNEGVALQDGIIYYGSENNPYASVGLRFSKQLDSNTLYVVNGSGRRGTGNMELHDLFVNGRIIGDIQASGDNVYARANNALKVVSKGDVNQLRDFEARDAILRDVIFNSLRTSDVNTNTYIGVGSNELRITNNQFYNAGNTVYRPIRAGDASFYKVRYTSLTQSSSEEFKENISPYHFDALDIISRASIYQFDYSNDLGNHHQGFIVERSTPIEWITRDRKGIDVGKIVVTLVQATKQLNNKNKMQQIKIEKLENRVTQLESEINKIMEMIA